MRFQMRRFLPVLAFSSTCALASIDSITIIPAQPRYMEPVYARLEKSAINPYPAWFGPKVTMANNGLRIELQWLQDLGQRTFDVYLGRFPAGTYSVDALEKDRGGTAPPTARFTVSDPPPSGPYPGIVPHVQATDLWWNASEPGWGVSIVQGPTNDVFATWFTYDANGQPTWYSLQPGRWTSQDNYEGPVYRTTGPWFQAPYGSRPLGVVQAGTGTLFFGDWNSGFLNFTIDGVRTTKPIVRQQIEQ